jgi:hypothetical protein
MSGNEVEKVERIFLRMVNRGECGTRETAAILTLAVVILEVAERSKEKSEKTTPQNTKQPS